MLSWARTGPPATPQLLHQGQNVGFCFRNALPTTSNPSEADAWISAGALCALSPLDWLLVSPVLSPQCRQPCPRTHSPVKPAQSRDLHFLGLPCPAAPWTPHYHTKERPFEREQGIQPLEGIRIKELAPQRSKGHALRLFQPPWTQTGRRAVHTRTLQSPPWPSPTVSGSLKDHACLPPASILPWRA